ncbi:hypothetical protein ITP53_54880, partial [Nonomuraea sp. K274]
MSQDARVTDGGQITQIAGNQITHHHHYPAGGAAVPRAPQPTVDRVRIGVIPQPADCFQNRQVAEQVQAAAGTGETVVLTQVLAGMGGVGKT